MRRQERTGFWTFPWPMRSSASPFDARRGRFFADAGAAGGGAAGGSGAAGSGGSAAGAGAAAAGPGPAAAAGSQAFVHPDGTLAEGWIQHASIPADLRANKTVLGVKSVGQMAQMLANAEALVGKKGSIIPTDPKDVKGFDAYFRAVGKPETPDKYTAPKLPEGIAPDPEFDKTIRAKAHELHMTDSQFGGLCSWIAECNVAERQNAQAASAAALEEAKAALRTKWGTKYDAHVQLANTAAAAFADEQELAYAKEKGWLDDPVFLSVFQKAGSAIAPDRLHARSDGGVDTGGIQSQIDDLMNSDAYKNQRGPVHDNVLAQIMQLRNQLRNTR